MQFLIIAYDGTDEGALERRMAAREAHLVGARAMKADGSMIVGGAILDDDGRMVGSSCIVEFPDRAAVERLIAPLDMMNTIPMDARAYKFDIVLRGRRSTLFENRLEGN